VKKAKKSGVLTKIIIIIVVAYAAISLIRVCDQIEKGKEEQAQLEQTVSQLELENAELQYAIEHKNDDKVKEDIARNELGLVKEGETVYYGE